MNINFYNYHHNGDIFLSKEFILDIIKKTNCNKPTYFHNNTFLLLKDIKDYINQSLITLNLHHNKSIFFENDQIYINTWVGSQNLKFYNGVGFKQPLRCSLYGYYEMFKEIYKTLNINIEDISYYVPTIKFENIDKTNIDNFCNSNLNKKILISNGNVLSGQSKNFDFNKIISELVNLYPNITFILTQKTDIFKPNVFYTGDITKLERDLVEIAYLSTFCDIIIGRASGPHTFTYIKDNIFNPNKTNISMCQWEYDGMWFFEGNYNNIWTNNYDEEHLLNLIIKQINE